MSYTASRVRACSRPLDFPKCKKYHLALLISLGAVGLAGPVMAAEPLPPPVPVFTWSGLYVGGQIGYAWGRDNASWTGAAADDLDPAAGAFGLGTQGVIGGAHVGYNLQLNPWFLIGVEGSADGTSLSKTVTVPLVDFPGDSFGSMTANSNARVQGSVRGRIGLVWDRLLLYGTAGVAVTSFNTGYIDTTGFFTGTPGTSTIVSNTRAGYTVGGGIEYAVTDNWSIRAEYRYSNFGHTTDNPFANPNNVVLPAGGSFVVQHFPRISQVQVGFSYRFDWTAPPAEEAPLVAKN